jgi:hypothetical protein
MVRGEGEGKGGEPLVKDLCHPTIDCFDNDQTLGANAGLFGWNNVKRQIGMREGFYPALF